MPYVFKTIWSKEDQEFAGLCDKYPSLSHLDPDEDAALKGIKELVLDVWCDQYVDTRDDLTYRKAKGEKLNKIEEALLEALNADLEELMPDTTMPLSPETPAAMEAVLGRKV